MADYTRNELETLIKEVMGIKSITPMINKQINRFVLEYKMSFKDIARCIVWYTEVAGGTLVPMYGLGILPNIKESADEYFRKLEEEQKKKAEEAQKVVQYQDNNIIFNIGKLSHSKRKPKQFDINEIKIKGDSNGEHS